MGRPAFPFIDQGKNLGYTRERKKRKRKTEMKGALELRRPPPPRAGPVGPTDDSGSVRTPQPCPSLALQAGATVLVVGPLSVTGATGGRRYSAVAPRPVLACDTVNRFPCLGSHGDQVAQRWSARHCGRCECLCIAYGGRRSH
jgi:hypothetical protein